jgi:hypothetical protein
MRNAHASTAAFSFVGLRPRASNARIRNAVPSARKALVNETEADMKGEWGPTTTRTVDLGYEQLLVLHARPGTRVRVLYGNLWLTEEGDARDVFASAGDEVALRPDGRSVIEALGLARVQVLQPVRRTALGSWLLRLRVALARRRKASVAGAAAACASRA